MKVASSVRMPATLRLRSNNAGGTPRVFLGAASLLVLAALPTAAHAQCAPSPFHGQTVTCTSRDFSFNYTDLTINMGGLIGILLPYNGQVLTFTKTEGVRNVINNSASYKSTGTDNQFATAATALTIIGHDSILNNSAAGRINIEAINSATALSIGGARVRIENHGEIKADHRNAAGTAIAVRLLAADAVFNNYGVVNGETSGIDITGVGARISNFGGTITGRNGLAISGSAGSDLVLNDGLISTNGPTAVDLGLGADTYLTAAGGSVTGVVNGGGGADTDTFGLTGVSGSVFDTGQIGTVYQGFEAFEKRGAGAWRLTGSNAAALPWTISEGTLLVDAGMGASSFTVEAGATFGGAGTIGSLDARGVVSPGAPSAIGTLTVAGNALFGATSVYQVDVNTAGQSDRIVADSATINSAASVDVRAGSGSYAPGQTYAILTTNAGVTGRFSNQVTTNLAFLRPTLVYSDPNAVVLQFSRNTTSMASLGRSPNQRSVGNAVDSLPDGNSVKQAALALGVSEVGTAFDALSGEAHASAQSQMLGQSERLRGALLSRMRSATDPTSSVAALFDATPVAYAADKSLMVAPVPTDRSHDLEAWGQAFGSMGRTSGDGNAAALDRNTGGVLLGLEAGAGGAFRAGFAGSFASTSFDVAGRASAGSVDTGAIAVYGGGRFGDLAVRGGASYARSEIDVARATSFRGFSGATNASYAGETAQAFAEIGYSLGLGRASFEPFAGVTYSHTSTDRFSEVGSAAALTGEGEGFDVVFSTAGLRVSAPITVGAGALTFKGMLAWRHAFGDLAPRALVQFAGGGIPFLIAGTPVERDSAVVEAGFDWVVRRHVTVSLKYDGEVGARDRDHALRGGFAVRF